MIANAAADVKGLILCADDFAVHGGASHGIADLARMGRISATSVMSLSPRWSQDVALLQTVRGQIDVGLHLDWTSEFALAAGHGLSLNRAMLRAGLGGFDQRQAAAVIEHQLDLFEAHWKAAPDFVDGHQHVQQFAGIRDALVQVLARRYGNGPTPYLRISRAPAGLLDLKSRVIAAMGAIALEHLAHGAGLRTASALSGIYDFSGDAARYAALMPRWLRGAPADSIIMCHPARSEQADDAIAAARCREYHYLRGPDFAAALVQAGVQLQRGRR
jgi:predicted glycoside hydrolase/deacetylase ChbG (UPF0249 family)